MDPVALAKSVVRRIMIVVLRGLGDVSTKGLALLDATPEQQPDALLPMWGNRNVVDRSVVDAQVEAIRTGLLAKTPRPDAESADDH